MASVEWDGAGRIRKGFACWYPQMGGYVGKCVVEPMGGPDDCFEAFVWHDGEFPFSTEYGDRVAVLHHCSAAQFVKFGQGIIDRLAEGPPPKAPGS